MNNDLLHAAEVSLEQKKKEFERTCEKFKSALEVLADVEGEMESERQEIAQIEGAIAALRGEPIPALKESMEEAPAPKPKKEPNPNNPYAQIPCAGCGEVGKLSETIKMAGSKPLRMLNCGSCGNQTPI